MGTLGDMGTQPLRPLPESKEETVFWIVSAAILAVVLLGAWLYDRRHGVDLTRAPSDLARAEAEAAASATEHRSSGGMYGF